MGICAPLFGLRPLSADESKGTILSTCAVLWRGLKLGGWEMSFRGLKTILLACGGVAALVAATGAANAGGFAVREQSAWGQGTSYAGVAAGGSLSAMFWNPATMTQIPASRASRC